MDTFAIRFKYLRKSENLTQTEIAKILDTTNSSICDWECQRSEPSLFMLAKICYFFKYSGIQAKHSNFALCFLLSFF